jgi:hypothetical protein
MSKSKVWFNRHFSCVAKVIREIRKEPQLSHLQFWVSHRHASFAGYELADRAFLEPSSLDSEGYLAWVLQTVQENDIDCLVPGHEQSFLTKHAVELGKLGCRVFQAAPAHYVGPIHSKDWVYQQVKGIVPLPRFYVVHKSFELRQAVEAILLSGCQPCIKPVNSVYGLGFYRITSSDRPHRTQCQSVSQWLDRYASSDQFAPQLVMEYLPGHEYSIDIAARHGELLASVMRQKPLQPGPQKIVCREELLQYVTTLVKRFQLNGLINVQFKEDRFGEPKLLEINPRASGGIGMSCQSGVNLPAIAYQAFFDSDWYPGSTQVVRAGQLVFESTTDLRSDGYQLPQAETREMESISNCMTEQLLSLPTGELKVRFFEQSKLKADKLLGFGARNNRKRGFLFVSRVLGKHIPVRPNLMREVHQELAVRIVDVVRSRNSTGIVIGMAETATGLGMGIFGELQTLANATHWKAYFQTTRYPQFVATGHGSKSLQFEEAHSHATQLSLELPEESSEQYQALVSSDLVVLVDDEISTGSTFANLLQTLTNVNKSLKHVIVATITDLSDSRVQRLLSAVDGIASVSVVSLLKGSYEFEPKETASASCEKNAHRDTLQTETQKTWSGFSARQGIAKIREIPDEVIQECTRHLTPQPCRVVGTNEFMDPAYRLALHLEARGWTTTIQSTTRSPVLLSHDIKSSIAITDPYCSRTENFLYNFQPLEGENVLLVHESANEMSVDSLIKTMCEKRKCIEVNLLLGRVVVHGESTS